MSGVMIKMGIYGLLRVLPFLGPPPAWWGAVLILVGAVSGVAGVLHALAQHDLKRLLAYHSVENIGIIALGIGIGLLGQHHGNPTLATLGYAGALLHTLNHGLFKGLLFQGAGSVLHGSGTRHLESLGGLYRRMPATGTAFLVGSVAICGLPPLNGFVSEWLIYLGAFRGGASLPASGAVVILVTLPALALIGGLATACFVKVFGVVFLGEPRSDHARHAHEVGLAMRAPMLAAAVACLAIGLWPAGALALVAPAAVSLSGTSMPADLGPLFNISLLATVLVASIGVLAWLRARLLKRRPIRQAATWGCGYPHPTPRMQYTATSFADPVLAPFSSVLQIRTHGGLPNGIFPAEAHFERHVGDMAGERVLVPAWRRFLHTARRLRVIQHGRMQLYLVYVLATLVALVLWQLSGGCNACEADLNVTGIVVFDIGRFGIQFVASPRHADGIVVTGPVTSNMAFALRETYAAVPEPKLVIAAGACAISGGPFAGSSTCANGIPADIPVDLYLPGCPPHPLTILDGLLRLLGRIESG